MHGEALAWSERTLGAPVRQVLRLPGGVTSTMLALADATGRQSVLRLMTEEPWRTHGAALTRRESAAFDALTDTPVPAPASLALDAEGEHTGVAAHLMTRMPGSRLAALSDETVPAMARMLATIHDVRPARPFRTYESWAWVEKRQIPVWTGDRVSWQRAFAALDDEPPAYRPTFLHRDHSHRNLLWDDTRVTGVVDWVETSTGPAWLDAAHAATNLAMAFGPGPAHALLAAYAAETGSRPEPYWLVLDAVGFLPSPGQQPMFGSAGELARLDAWVAELVR